MQAPGALAEWRVPRVGWVAAGVPSPFAVRVRFRLHDCAEFLMSAESLQDGAQDGMGAAGLVALLAD